MGPFTDISVLHELLKQVYIISREFRPHSNSILLLCQFERDRANLHVHVGLCLAVQVISTSIIFTEYASQVIINL